MILGFVVRSCGAYRTSSIVYSALALRVHMVYGIQYIYRDYPCMYAREFDKAGKQMSIAGSSGIVKCPLCGYILPYLTLHVSHLQLVHSSDRSFNIVCSIRGCKEAFDTFAAYNKHVYHHHRDALGLQLVYTRG